MARIKMVTGVWLNCGFILLDMTGFPDRLGMGHEREK